MRYDGGVAANQIDGDLGGLIIYARDLLRTLFGFLIETMRFAASIAGEAGALPQVSWLTIESRMALAIYIKRVEPKPLRNLCSSLLKEAKTQLDSRVKMGIKTLDWGVFEAEDDLTNIRDRYSFMTASNHSLIKDKLCLLHKLIANEASRSFFTRGINGSLFSSERIGV